MPEKVLQIRCRSLISKILTDVGGHLIRLHLFFFYG